MSIEENLASIEESSAIPPSFPPGEIGSRGAPADQVAPLPRPRRMAGATVRGASVPRPTQIPAAQTPATQPPADQTPAQTRVYQPSAPTRIAPPPPPTAVDLGLAPPAIAQTPREFKPTPGRNQFAAPTAFGLGSGAAVLGAAAPAPIEQPTYPTVNRADYRSVDAGYSAPRTRRRRHPLLLVVSLFVLFSLLWPIGLMVWANSQLQRVSALSGAANTPGTTVLVNAPGALGQLDLAGLSRSGLDLSNLDLSGLDLGELDLEGLRSGNFDPRGLNLGDLDPSALAALAGILANLNLDDLDLEHLDLNSLNLEDLNLDGLNLEQLESAAGISLPVDAAFVVNQPTAGRPQLVAIIPSSARAPEEPVQLVRAAEQTTGLTVDRYVQIDPEALAEFNSARQDTGTAQFWLPTRQVALLRAGLHGIVVDDQANILDVLRFVWTLRSTIPQLALNQ